MARQAVAGEIGRDAVLVRRLVRAEARVAVKPVDRPVRAGDVLGSEARQGRVQSLHQFPHGLLHQGLEIGFAWQEPLARVVPREGAEEIDAFAWKSGKRGSHGSLPYN